MDYKNHVTSAFLGAGGLVLTGDTIQYPVGRKWYGAIEYADFLVGLVTGSRVVLMSDEYGNIDITRGEAVTFARDKGVAKRRILERINHEQ